MRHVRTSKKQSRRRRMYRNGAQALIRAARRAGPGPLRIRRALQLRRVQADATSSSLNCRQTHPEGLFFLGQYGGIEFQGVRASDTYQPKRFFSYLRDAQLRALVEVDFCILEFQVVDLPDEREPGLHFQALVLRRQDR